MNDNQMLAISSIGMDKLSVDINDMAESINLCFNNINSLFDTLNEAIEGELYESIKSRYDEISQVFPIITNNLLSYKEDIIALKNNYIERDKSINTSEVEKVNLEGRDFHGVKNGI